MISNDHPHFNGRVCSKCNEFKPAKEFAQYKDKNYKGGIAMRADCKTCSEKVKYKAFIKRTYNFTFEEYEEMLDQQNGKCSICESKIGSARTTRLFVDHCHETGKVRGLLCSSCNNGLGQFKDSPKLLQKAINYLLDSK